MIRWNTLSVAVLIVAGSLLACKKSPKGGEARPAVGSCDMRSGAASGGSSICIDFHKEPNAKVREICSPSSGYILSTTPCNRAGSLGGCASENLTNWYYPSTRHSKPDDVEKECGSGKDLVRP
ncbi:MAG: hypothetical protein KIT72_14710 [Polyangiaceae bacterium]|nr:hypothetical protein [Polyangiaceae bacterium]MCW5791666.1 hypothetical protein [Polyangiaceae bacterium]